MCMVRVGVFIMAFGIFVFWSMQESRATYNDAAPGKYLLTGRISDTVDLPPACGYFAFATAVEMEVISYSDTSYKRDHIVVIFTCPDFYDDEYFKVGQVHSVKVQDHNPASFNWAIINNGKQKENLLPYDLYVIDKAE